MVLHADNYRRFIREHLQQSGLLQKELAAEVDRSPAWVSQMLAGKRPLRAPMARRVGEALKMSARDRLRLEALVESEDKRSLVDHDAEPAPFVKAELGLFTEGPLDSRLDTWQLCAVYQLALCDAYRPDPAWIAATVRPRMDEAEARSALETLRARGLMDDAGHLSDEAGSASDNAGPDPEACAAYHEQALDCANHALQQAASNERAFVGGCVALSEDDYERFRQHLQSIVLHILRTSAKQTPNRLYQVNLAVFPVSLYSDSAADPQTIED
ncbi:MAG: TIGR02147 family protein [Myxococcota bacterium]